MVIRTVLVPDHHPRHTPSIRYIKKQVVEHESIAEGWLRPVRRIRETFQQHAPRRLVRAEHRVEVAANDAVARRKRLQESFGLPSACAIGKKPPQPPEPILEVRR